LRQQISMTNKLQHKVILVTGAAAGIGKCVAIELASQGADLILSDINNEAGLALAKYLNETYQINARFVEADVSKSDQVQALMNSIATKENRLDCAVNNAGVEQPLCKTADCEEFWAQRCFDINLMGTFLCMKYELKVMLEQGRGNIINVASVAGVRAAAMASVYAASKHGVVGLSRTAAAEYAASNIRINSVCPGATNTNMVARGIAENPGVEERLLNNIAMGRLGEPTEIARAIAWLCSDDCEYMTGQSMVIDGASVG